MDRYLPIFGPNTRQWWIYDEELDVYIDPPTSVLRSISKFDFDRQEEKLNELANAKPGPKWLYETEHYYTKLEP